MANKLTYIASGCWATRLPIKDAFLDEECYHVVKSILTKMQRNKDHTFGLLYNAFIDSSVAPSFKNYYSEYVDGIHADSGGLQMITLGKSVTEKRKDLIYTNQAKYSTVAMSFDVIPVGFNEDKTSKMSVTDRWFEEDMFINSARLSGINLFEQIKRFIELKSTSKPLLVVHGNSYDSFMKWVELVLAEIPHEYTQYISGVAVSGAAHGQGILEDIQRSFICTQLPIETKHVHLLGIGSLHRMLPHLIFLNSDLYKDTLMTYDSTSHTGGHYNGRYYFKDGHIDFDKKMNTQFEIVYNDVRSMFDVGLDIDTFFTALHSKSREYKIKHGSRRNVILSNLSTIMKSIDNFKCHIDRCLNSKDVLLNSINSSVGEGVYESLYEIKNKSDYDYWMRNNSKYVPSRRVSERKPFNLEGFF